MILKGDLKRARPIFLVVGTDTGVGKTIFSGLLGKYLRGRGVGLRLAKPFCSGGRGDVEFLQVCSALGQAEVNYWYDDEPISPAAWELRTGKSGYFEGCVEWLKKIERGRLKSEGEVLLVEGVGGLLAPLAKGKTVASLGQVLGAKLIVVASNRVGVVNHVLLTLEAAMARGLSVACVVLIGQENPDASSMDNAELIRMNMPNNLHLKEVYEFPWLGKGADDLELITINVKKSENVLENIFDEVFKPYSINVLGNK